MKPFSAYCVDKQKTVDIIKQLSKQLKEEKTRTPESYCLNQYTTDNHFNVEKTVHRLAFCHKLSTLQIDLSENIEFDLAPTLKDFYRDIITGKYDQECDQSDDVEVYECTTDNETIMLTAFLYGVSHCGVGKFSFVYDETLRCWVESGYGYDDEETYIDGNGLVTILDFSHYFACCDQ